MSLTGRIKLYLIAVALVPPLLIISVIYFQTMKSSEAANRREVFVSLQKYGAFRQSLEDEVTKGMESLVSSAAFKKNMAKLRSGKTTSISFDPKSYGLSFAELLTPDLKVLSSYHRPGLVGDVIQPSVLRQDIETGKIIESVEYDIAGIHVALTKLRPIENEMWLYSGVYINKTHLNSLSQLMNAKVRVCYAADSLNALAGMDRGSIYDHEDSYRLLLMGSSQTDYAIVANFDKSGDSSAFYSLLGMTCLVAFFSVAVSVGLGIYVTNRAEREIDNLVQATSRVAAGDFGVPVMAYEEGAFSQLADSFTDMTMKLKTLQKQLSTSEKIAAWQIVGRKIAHEIKNPLTPISISADDLRKSYKERLPGFDKTLEETTTTIKNEVARMNSLLNQFVSFARMKAPEIRKTEINSLVDGVSSLYRIEQKNGRFLINNDAQIGASRFDPEALQQVLINLIKNGLEAKEDSIVSVVVGEEADFITFRVEDTGPGFTDEKLQNSFEPYATTKEGGSGLGLVICHRIVYDHGGTMELYNCIKGGAGVLIRIPA